jgi:phosphate transport system permease protein
VSEFAKPAIVSQVKLWLDVLNGFPSIVIGIFVYTLAVKSATPILGIGHHQSAYAGGFALSIIMIPLVARTTMEVLALVPNNLREASYGLGVSKWRTVISVILPTAFGGILTGTTLAVARAAGETAPMIFTNLVYENRVSTDPSQALASIPLTIFNYSESFDTHLNDQAWAAAFVLMSFVLVSSLTARALLMRSERRLRGR